MGHCRHRQQEEGIPVREVERPPSLLKGFRRYLFSLTGLLSLLGICGVSCLRTDFVSLLRGKRFCLSYLQFRLSISIVFHGLLLVWSHSHPRPSLHFPPLPLASFYLISSFSFFGDPGTEPPSPVTPGDKTHWDSRSPSFSSPPRSYS